MKPTHCFGKMHVGALAFMVFMCLAGYSHAQSKNIQVTLKDKLTHAPLANATATLIDLKDSMIVAIQQTKADGIVKFDVSGNSKYQINIEKQGYEKGLCYGAFSKREDDLNMYFTVNMNKKMNMDKKSMGKQ